MSTYYTYYLAYEHEEKIYPLGPYDCFRSLKPIFSRSSSFASDLHDEFWHLPDNMMSEELKKEFQHKNFKGDLVSNVYYRPICELPDGDYIKKGYFLMEDVKKYEEDGDDWDLFYDTVTPTVYAAMVQQEKMFGAPKEKKDCEGTPYTPHAASDYMYYAYADRHCPEYEAELIRSTADMLNKYTQMPKDATIVAIMTIT